MNNIKPNTKMIINKYKSQQKHFIFMENKDYFYNTIKEQLKAGKKLIIPCMSSETVLHIYNLFKESYRCIHYIGSTDDKQKIELKDVNDVWINYDLVIYSPCIESGVDFNVEYFDYMHIILSANSTSQRGLSQMIGRVRKLKNKEINVFLNGIPPNQFTYNEYNYLETKTKTRKKYSKYPLLNDIHAFNLQEELNKSISLFYPIFKRMQEEKGHKCTLHEEVVKSKKDIGVSNVMIANAEVISNEKFDELKMREAKRELTQIEKMQIQKAFLRNIFNLEFNCEKEVSKYKGLVNAIRVLNRFKNNEENEIDKAINDLFFAITNKNMVDLLQLKEVVVSNDEYKNAVSRVHDIAVKHKVLLKLDKNIKVESMKKMSFLINDILGPMGIMLECKRAHNINKRKFVLDEIIINKINHHDCMLEEEVDEMLKAIDAIN